MFGPSGDVIPGHASDTRGIEPSGLCQHAPLPQRARLFRKAGTEPVADRCDEALLGAIEHVLRQEGFHRLLEQPLALPALYTEVFGQPRGELDQPVVQQGLARFEADRHAGAIHLGEDVARQEKGEVGILRLVETGPCRCAPHDLYQPFLRAIAGDPACEIGAVKGRSRFGRGDRKAARIAFRPVAGEAQQRGLRAQRTRRPVGLGIEATERAKQALAQSRGNGGSSLFLAVMEDLPPIARQRFVRPVARQRHGDVLARKLAHAPCRQGARIGEGFVEHRRDGIEMCVIAVPDHAGAMVRSVTLRDALGIGRLVERGDIEADGAGGDGRIARLAHQRDRGRTVHTA